MDLPAASWVNLALQIPLALVIVVLVVYFLRHLEGVTKSMLDFMKNQSEVNREFIRTQQESHNLAIGRLAEEIKSDKVDMVREISALTQRVDGVIDKVINWSDRQADRERNKKP